MYQNTALNANIFVRALHCNSTELIALSLQIHILSTGCGNCLRLDARRRNLGYSRTFRGKHYILICLYIRGNRYRAVRAQQRYVTAGRYSCISLHLVPGGYFNIACHCRYGFINRDCTFCAQ